MQVQGRPTGTEVHGILDIVMTTTDIEIRNEEDVIVINGELSKG